MSISIKNGMGFRNAAAMPFVKSPNHGGALKPRFIVIHDTASGLKDDGDISWLTNPAAKVSAHVVVSRQGKITQLVPFNVVAWHAGHSQWKG
ncbi:N-acetylmuramoyl-L-alanine amidase [Bradyrhizobium liaoningense]|uniref:N-acetylmuramoyl-L-alanine amidase n=1 Tax=Bradyrhizobium liaoningense TaxID=43992 RepID=UPI00201336C8|nr:N-acetylmuramoyl-L-alanine amidase [Bradyrhizobium liaoningense]